MDDLGVTAIGVAAIRAMESAREDRLFDDPYAMSFVRAYPEALPARPPQDGPQAELLNAFVAHAVLRTRFFDEYLLAAGCSQVVLLAAGLDTRAFRLDWPAGTRLFELERQVVLDAKDPVLADAEPRCRRTVVPADLGDDWPAALTAAGFRAGEPTAWLAEGVLVYLSREESETMLRRVTELSGAGSTLSFEHGSGLPEHLRDAALTRFAGLWKDGGSSATPERLAELGWHSTEHALSDVAGRYGREAPELTGGGFLTARLGA